jgi:hypothetical protein
MEVESPTWMDGTEQCLSVTIDGIQCAVPSDTGNKEYRAVLAWAEIDGNVIADEAPPVWPTPPDG